MESELGCAAPPQPCRATMHTTALTSSRFALQTILHALSVAMTMVVAIFSMIGLVREDAHLMSPLTAIWFLSSLTVLSTAASALDWYIGRVTHLAPATVSSEVALKRETFRRVVAAIIVWSAVQTTLTLAMVSVYVRKYGYDDPFGDEPNDRVRCSREHAWQRMNEISFVSSSLVLVMTAMVYTLAYLHHLFDVETPATTPLLTQPAPSPAPTPEPAPEPTPARPPASGARNGARPQGLPPLAPRGRGRFRYTRLPHEVDARVPREVEMEEIAGP